MARSITPVPAGYHALTPYLIVQGAAKAIDFYRTVFSARERMRMPGPDGKIGHAEIEIGDSLIMLADEFPQMNAKAPPGYGGSPVHLHLYVTNVDDVVANAARHGAAVLRQIEDQFYGDRTGTVQDPFGHVWHIGTHVEDIAPDELHRRAAERAKAPG